MRTIYRAGILTAALMVLVLGGCSGFDRGGGDGIRRRPGADARLGLDARPGSKCSNKEGGQGRRVWKKNLKKYIPCRLDIPSLWTTRATSPFCCLKAAGGENRRRNQVDIYPAGQLGSAGIHAGTGLRRLHTGFRGTAGDSSPGCLCFPSFLCEDRTQAERLVNSNLPGNKHGFPEKRSHHDGNRRAGLVPAVSTACG